MKTASFFLFILIALGLLFPADAFACACCTEPGTYRISTGKVEAYQLAILQEIRFDQAASLFMTEAGFEGIKGLREIEKDFESGNWTASPADFSLTNSFAAKTWKFNFKTRTGKTGSLTLPVPAQMVRFSVDIHDGSDRGLGPLLYKEWRFKGNVLGGNGIFKSGIIKPTTYFLVFQGRGNNCDDVLDFTHWRLEINGRNADYAFFGKLVSGNVQKSEDKNEHVEN